MPHIAVTKFVAFGDSITWGEDGRNDVSESLGHLGTRVLVPASYPVLVQAYLAARYTAQTIVVDKKGCRGEAAGGGSGLDADNTVSGCGGTTTNRFHSVVVLGGYPAVLLMEGSNDVDNDDGIAGLRTMIEDAKAHGITVFLGTIPPEQPNSNPIPYDRSKSPDDVKAFNDQVRTLASTERVILVDVFNAFPSPDSTDLYALGLLSRDGLHPLEGGYQLIAERFFTSMVRSLELPVVTTASVHK